uniref:Uncharacterized protein n=1 Tax=Setaria viridis TaxID=4556 RepID=A0A4U6UA85_SETVI|nr:hypothetical protein SEVIR_6G222301v2 [Setaria viridis]
MGQISDEVWNTIQSNETDIRGTVEAVYIRILNPEKGPEPSSKKLKRMGKEQQVLPAKTPTTVAARWKMMIRWNHQVLVSEIISTIT